MVQDVQRKKGTVYLISNCSKDIQENPIFLHREWAPSSIKRFGVPMQNPELSPQNDGRGVQ